jgi:hypothetical protein
MGGLLEGAKQKIWSIANDMISAKPTPELKVGLVGYRDRGDEYVVRPYALTDDIDAMYGHLTAFQAGGGGDTPESVNEALAEAINKMKWSQDRDVLKIVFLVGDAPPHMDYADGPKYPELCRAAAMKDLIINTVQCGSMTETAPIWKEIAKMSEGNYAAIAQSGNMEVVSTPMDDKLAELNKRMGQTLIPYGDANARRGVAAKQAASESAPAPAAADRLSYNSRTNKAVQGGGELVDALARNELKPNEIDQKKLPAEFQKLNRDEVVKRVAQARKIARLCKRKSKRSGKSALVISRKKASAWPPLAKETASMRTSRKPSANKPGRRAFTTREASRPPLGSTRAGPAL